jgi:(p)ppGpp synthase/HD superfamily hydrolase
MDLATLLKTTNFAAIKHSSQRRKDPEQTPYINHPIGVAYILSKEVGITDISVLQAALLHDTVEDTDTTFEELTEIFGETVSLIVREVTDDTSLSKMERKAMQIAKVIVIRNFHISG